MTDSSEVKSIDNLEVHGKDGYVVVSVNPKMYSLDIVYSASYVFLDKAYVVLDGDPIEEITVQLRPKDGKVELEALGRDFNNELIKYAVYRLHSAEGQEIRERIISKALETNSCESKDEDDELDDPLGIAKPWEESDRDG
jgi:His-Xaa-Ser system protein HxsD